MASRTDFLRSLSCFAGLGAEEIQRIEKGMVKRSFGKGRTLFLEGEPCEGLYIVESGVVRIFKSSPEGREQVVMMARPGDVFNVVPVFDDGLNPASASALEPSTVLIVPKETLLSLVADSPAALAIIRLLAARLRHLTTLVEDLSLRRVVSRLARVLLELAVVEGGASPAVALTQGEMASMVGTVRDVIGRALRDLEEAGAIRMERHRILIADPQRLREMV